MFHICRNCQPGGFKVALYHFWWGFLGIVSLGAYIPDHVVAEVQQREREIRRVGWDD